METPVHDREIQDGRPSQSDSEGDLTLLDLVIVLAKNKKLIIGLPLAAGIAAAVTTLFMTPIYTATTRILPPQQSQSATASILGQLGPFAGMAGGAIGIKSPADLYVGLLGSRSVADNVIRRFNLEQYYQTKYLSDARSALGKAAAITVSKDGLIVIAVDSKDPGLSAALANGYVDELTKLTDHLAVTEAGQRRLFFERQLVEAKNNLSEAEVLARRAIEQGGIAMVDEQGKSMVETTAALRAQIAAKEVQIGGMKSFAAEGNPEFVRARQELSVLKGQMEKIETGAGLQRNTEDNKAKGLRSLSLLRDVKYYQVLVDLLSKQYEAAKIDEAREGAIVQIVDRAVAPERRSKPNRTLLVIVPTLLAGFLAVLWAFIKEGAQRVVEDPYNKDRIARLRHYLAWHP